VGRKESIAGVFGRAAPTYERVGPRPFAHVGRRLVELAAVEATDAVLDVATGRGAVLFPAAERADRVVGIDLAKPMIEALSEEIAERGVANAMASVMDGDALDFPDGSFDVVLCSLSIFFLDVERALEEFRRVLRPGGTMGLTTFGKGDPRWDWHRELLRSLMREEGEQRPRPSRAPADVESAEELEALLAGAGYDHVRVHEEAHELCFADAEEWWQWIWSQGQRGFLESLDEDRLERYRADAYARLPAPIVNRWTVLYAVGRRP
jgi:ubiquinone/menaquinone biosynthesis C-methylase UbiE